LIESTLVYHQRHDEAAGEELYDYAWAALQLLVDEGCVELVGPPSPRVENRVKTTAAATAAGGIDVPEGGGGGGGRGDRRRVDHKRAVETASSRLAPSQLTAKRPKCAIRPPQGAQAPPVRAASAAATAVTIVPAAASHEHQGTSLQEFGSGGGGGDEGSGGGVGAKDDRLLVPTKLGLAIFRSSMPPGDGLTVYRDLSEAKNGINLRHPLYLSYLLTPLCPPAGLKPNWERLRAMYASAQAAAEKTPPDPNAHLVEDFHKIGITENHLHLWASRGPVGGAKEGPLLSHAAVLEAARARRGSGSRGGSGGATATAAGKNCRSVESSPLSSNPGMAAAKRAVRLVAAMALKDVSDGCNLGQVAKSYGMNKGELQSLRQSTATFAGMVASFLKELGWTIFLMLVKGFVPKLSLGVNNQLLPLMQVPGMSRKEASALFQEGIVNAKSLISASSERVATALRINVPFRAAAITEGGTSSDKGVGGCFRFERRAQILANSARAIGIRREKGNKAQAMKLLKAVQGRLGSDSGGVLTDLSGGNDLVCVVSQRHSCRGGGDVNHDRQSSSGIRSSRGGGNLGETGLSDDDVDSDSGGSDSNGSITDDDDDDIIEGGDAIDMAVAAFLSGVAREDDSDDDSDGGGYGGDVGGAGAGEDRLREGGGGGAGRENTSSSSREAGNTPAVTKLPARAAAPRVRQHPQQCNAPPPPPEIRDPAVDIVQQQLPQQQRFGGGDRTRGLVALGRKREAGQNVGELKAAANREVAFDSLSSCRGTGSANDRTSGGGAAVAQKPPAVRAAEIFVTPRNNGGQGEAPGSADNDRTMRTPVRRLTPESSPSSFLYEAGTDSCPAILDPNLSFCDDGEGEDDDEDDEDQQPAEGRGGTRASGGRSPSTAATSAEQQNLRVGPAFAACRTRTSWADLNAGGDGAGINSEGGGPRDVFAEGAAAVANFSSAWRRSKCFSFVLGSRNLAWLGDNGRGGSGRRGEGGARDRPAWEYGRSWEALVAPPTLPVAPYTVPSGGEGGVPLSQRGDGGS
ncbi:unnamed protein product, partial [Hapterophycus canaliculatus]